MYSNIHRKVGLTKLRMQGIPGRTGHFLRSLSFFLSSFLFLLSYLFKGSVTSRITHTLFRYYKDNIYIQPRAFECFIFSGQIPLPWVRKAVQMPHPRVI